VSCCVAGKLPTMETSSFNTPAAFVQEGDVGPVPHADTTTLGAYLGNADLTALGDAAALAAAAAGELSPAARAAGRQQWQDSGRVRVSLQGCGMGGVVLSSRRAYLSCVVKSCCLSRDCKIMFVPIHDQ
jgi:hypothetical protein